MTYSDADVAQMTDAFHEWRDRLEDVAFKLIAREWSNDRSREYASHGFGRRAQMLRHCIDRTFEVLPPQATDPSRETLMDVSAFVQTFYINIYGAFDNLAHLWVNHYGITRQDGSDLRWSDIGFGKKQKHVWQSLPEEITAYLTGMAEWQNYFEGYRHALAHRISLYIPPRALNKDATAEYEALEHEIGQAQIDGRKQDVYELLYRQSRLGTFQPLIQHSYGEGARPMKFHAQMICDIASLAEFTELLFAELS